MKASSAAFSMISDRESGLENLIGCPEGLVTSSLTLCLNFSIAFLLFLARLQLMRFSGSFPPFPGGGVFYRLFPLVVLRFLRLGVLVRGRSL